MAVLLFADARMLVLGAQRLCCEHSRGLLANQLEHSMQLELEEPCIAIIWAKVQNGRALMKDRAAQLDLVLLVLFY